MIPSPLLANELLAALPRAEGDAIAPFLEEVVLPQGAVLQRPGEPVQFVYFPITGMIALMTELEDGTDVNILGVGRDGAVHAGPDADASTAPFKAVVQLAGATLRIRVRCWHDLLARRRLRAAFRQYNEFTIERLQQAVVCQAKHDAESRLCSWLLEMYEWQRKGRISLTHDALARMLGVRRTTITLMARLLQDASLISYRRGVIEIVDAYGLQQASCECYKAVQQRSLAFRQRFAMGACKELT